ncbi:MAG: DUF1232 domain-containing protein [Myxococcales bacterium]|nr:DUF1232 domain-containing protein [Myxococcales bacterium]
MADPVVPQQHRKRGVSAVPFFGDLLALSRLVRDPGAAFGWKVLAVATFLYVVSPVDAFPEAFMPLVAWVDDVGLVLAIRLLLDKRLAIYRYPLFGDAPPRVLPDPVGAAPSRGT